MAEGWAGQGAETLQHPDRGDLGLGQQRDPGGLDRPVPDQGLQRRRQLLWTSPKGNDAGAHAMRDVSRGPDGRMWVTAYKEHQIKVYDVSPSGDWTSNTPVWVLGDGATNGSGVDQLNFPYNVDWSPDGDTVYVSDTGNGRIARWDLDGTEPVWLQPFGGRCASHPQPCPDPPADRRQVQPPPAGRRRLRRAVYGADFWGAGVRGVPSRRRRGRGPSRVTEPPAPGLSEAYGVDVAPDGQVYVMDRLNHRIQRFTRTARTSIRRAPGEPSRGLLLARGLDRGPRRAGLVGRHPRRPDRGLPRRPRRPSAARPVLRGHRHRRRQVQLPRGRRPSTPRRRGLESRTPATTGSRSFDPATGTFSVLGGGPLRQPMGVAVSGQRCYVADTAQRPRGPAVGHSTAALLASYSAGLTRPEGSRSRRTARSGWPTPRTAAWSTCGGPRRPRGRVRRPRHRRPQLDRPHYLAFGDGTLYVADTYNNRVQVFELGGATEPPPPPPPADSTPPITPPDLCGWRRGPGVPWGPAIAADRYLATSPTPEAAGS